MFVGMPVLSVGMVSDSSSESMLASAVMEGHSSVSGGTSKSVWGRADFRWREEAEESGGVLDQSTACRPWGFPPGRVAL